MWAEIGTLYLIVSCSKNSWNNSLSKLMKKKKGGSFSPENKVVIARKAFTDSKTNETTPRRRQCCLFYKDLWHTNPHPQTVSTPLSITQREDLHIVHSDMHTHSLGEGARASYMLDDARLYPPPWQEIWERSLCKRKQRWRLLISLIASLW